MSEVSTQAESATPRLTLTGITKAYPSVVANAGIDLEVAPGEIHAVLGENGAGKSTLMKIIYGVVRPDAGEMRWEGEVTRVGNPAEARALGIGMVFQHFCLFETLSVAENISLAIPGRLDELSARVREVSQRYGLSVDPRQSVYTLSVGERQRVEILRCLLQAPKLLIMDEPTSVLAPQAVDMIDALIKGQEPTGVKKFSLAELTNDPAKTGDVMANFLPVVQVTKANVYDVVVKSGFQSYDDVYRGIPEDQRPPRP